MTGLNKNPNPEVSHYTFKTLPLLLEQQMKFPVKLEWYFQVMGTQGSPFTKKMLLTIY